MFVACLAGSSICAEETVSLSDLEVEHVTTGWGEIGVNRSVSGTPLSVGGKTFDRGLGVHAMELKVEDGGEGIGRDHANWCDPVITFKGQKPRIVPESRPLSPSNRAQAKAALIPYPRQVEWHEDTVDLSRYRVRLEGPDGQKLALVSRELRAALNSAGAAPGTDRGATVELRVDSTGSGRESYRLTLTPERVVIRAPEPAGLFYGIQTLRQLAAADVSAVPRCSIVDSPAFKWRGFMHDLGRLSQIVDEFFDHVDLPYFHMGSDEVRVRNQAFIPGMTKLIRDHGKDIIVWRPGALPDHGVITQLWSGKPRPIDGVRYLESQSNYVNHMDPLTGPLRAFMQQPCRVREGTELALGGILCHWPDDKSHLQTRTTSIGSQSRCI